MDTLMFRFRITGVVQGVGFRPYLYAACTAAGLRGFVQNTGEGVLVEVDDAAALNRILQHPPPLARIDTIHVEEVDSPAPQGFVIKESTGKGGRRAAEIPPDLFLCEDCLRELRDPHDYRYGYFFITCTNCGPRYSLCTGTPYDREHTTMQEFPMCATCRAHYTDPANRRYHAQTVACAQCGPQLVFLVDGEKNGGLAEAAAALRAGAIIAVKGVGGFHLACRVTKATIRELRRLTGRPHKPFAVLCKDLAMVRRFATPTAAEERLLCSTQRPIVLVKKSAEKKTVHEASELDTLGVMLPYTGLHYLLFDHVNEPLIMTSANLAGEPITTRQEEQFVTHVLDHTRTIANPIDDSVVKVVGRTPLLLRRSRGYVPTSIPVEPRRGPAVLALGAEMNATFCLLKDGRATLSPHLGTLRSTQSLQRYREVLEHFLSFTKVIPQCIVIDKHPHFATRKIGHELARRFGARLMEVQHHVAHAWSAAAEHQLTSFTAIVCDGLGYGDDGTLWGGEVFVINGREARRLGHLEAHKQLGGDAANLHPQRMLYSILYKLGGAALARTHTRLSPTEQRVLEQQYLQNFNAPLTTSCGRVLDAAATLLGLCTSRSYDGRPALLLEAAATTPRAFAPVFASAMQGQGKDGGQADTVLLTTPLFRLLTEELSAGPLSAERRGVLAATVQHYLARGLYELAEQGRGPVVFSGGCAYNRLMTSFLQQQGVLVNTQVPAGDGGLSFGQAVWALISADSRHEYSAGRREGAFAETRHERDACAGSDVADDARVRVEGAQTSKDRVLVPGGDDGDKASFTGKA